MPTFAMERTVGRAGTIGRDPEIRRRDLPSSSC